MFCGCGQSRFLCVTLQTVLSLEPANCSYLSSWHCNLNPFIIMKILLTLAVATATPQKQPAQQTVTCLSQTKNILAVTDFAPQQFAYMNHTP